ncbi:MAG TPA: hypothetical protein VJL58_00090, partial [Pyrinomonadaceae bacterium]|nr:hypothetical protein [Pyrinomonadaceae bacterium]
MTLNIRKPGLLTTVQDLGRFGFRRLGINPNGVMDITAARTINILLGNDENAPVLEMHFPASEFEFEEECFFAIGGADFDAELDDSPIANWSVHSASQGAVLRFTKPVLGNRAYISVRDGFDVEDWLGSSSTNLTAGFGGFGGRQLKKGDRIPVSPSSDIP